MLGVLGAFDETRDAVHGTRPVEGDDGGDVLNALRTQLDTDAGHARTFHLEDAHGLTGREHLEDRRVVLGHILHAETGLLLTDQAGGIFQNGEVPQTEKVHLQQTQLLQGCHLILTDDGFVVLCQRNIVLDGAFGDDDTGGMGGGVAGHTFQRAGNIDEGAELLI